MFNKVFLIFLIFLENGSIPASYNTLMSIAFAYDDVHNAHQQNRCKEPFEFNITMMGLQQRYGAKPCFLQDTLSSTHHEPSHYSRKYFVQLGPAVCLVS